MQLSLAALAYLVAASGLASALPLERRGTKMMTSKTRFNAAGALYFITNEPDENMVIAASINSDGTLNLDRAVSAGGRGAHGLTDPLGPDALFAQGAIKASAKGQVLATVNPGSNTISLFSIDPKTPTNIQPLGDPVSSEGEFPMSLTFNTDGSRLCVLNGGTVNGVNCYTVDKKTGLTAMPNTLRSLGLNQTTPATGPAGSTSHIIFSEDGKQLLASVKGVPPNPGMIAVWDVADDGSLSADFKAVAPPSGGLLPFSMTVIPGKNAVLSTDPGVGFDVFDFGSGNSSAAVKIDGQNATCWSSFSSKTDNFYLSDIGTSIVTEVHVDDNLKASIVKQYQQTQGAATIDNDIATINGKDMMYVLAPGTQTVEVLALNSPGNAKHVQSLNIASPAKAAGVTINTNNLQGMTAFVRQ
ncbi:hypothetical protein BN946_scf185013.g77 [Trametes cinnabarina]|uniref:3-carboxymuconate cyclase n=1 Tax=Pycnoporus cinnabarinus TaxID=5643 RepID=A0A060SFZ8_PYCCI|nr:hypothetical protein BN946_scf185013.g77 [Trametes cinnabarina]